MVGWLKFNIIEKIPFMVYLEIQCITFKMEKSFIAHPWIQRSVVGLEEYSAHDWRAATSGTARPSYLARVGPVNQTMTRHRGGGRGGWVWGRGRKALGGGCGGLDGVGVGWGGFGLGGWGGVVVGGYIHIICPLGNSSNQTNRKTNVHLAYFMCRISANVLDMRLNKRTDIAN